jgi:hypothetical protein
MKDTLTLNESDLAVAFYDAAVDLERATFEAIAKRVFGPRGLSGHSAALRLECRRMFELARAK